MDKVHVVWINTETVYFQQYIYTFIIYNPMNPKMPPSSCSTSMLYLLSVNYTNIILISHILIFSLLHVTVI